MCKNGVNVGQLIENIKQIDEAVALSRRWTHRAYHAAEDGALPKTASRLKAAQDLLDEARALLDEAADVSEQEDSASGGVSVALV